MSLLQFRLRYVNALPNPPLGSVLCEVLSSQVRIVLSIGAASCCRVLIPSSIVKHRILRSEQAAGDRQNQRSEQHNAIPRLLATAPHDVWTWDITKLPLVRRGVYLSLYVLLDLYSRFVAAWMVSRNEKSAPVCQLMSEVAARYRITLGQLTIHQGTGALP
ncbi:DDE-type integrase/transposase/recombinase [Pseudomonadales bacterium]|nr:DDE-type integrase/transposase/recombinase [Pseudomonadales bacterium]MDB9868739.1 DDE-type integrase/transposase/recombinase [Pseudomonadales bacterium]